MSQEFSAQVCAGGDDAQRDVGREGAYEAHVRTHRAQSRHDVAEFAVAGRGRAQARSPDRQHHDRLRRGQLALNWISCCEDLQLSLSTALRCPRSCA